MNSQFLKHLKFWFASTNHHGVHSPFIFDYLTKCLYQKRMDGTSKVLDILMKSIPYFDAKRLMVLGNEGLKDRVIQSFPQIVFDLSPHDLIYVQHIEKDLNKAFSLKNRHNDTMVLINSIHRNRETEEKWNQIVLDDRASVTIDFFYCGAVFFRKEQVKEHFKIRI